MGITEVIAMEHVTLLRVFDQVERILPGLRSAEEVGTMATLLEGMLGTNAQLEGDFAFAALDPAPHDKRGLAALHEEHREVDDRFRRVGQAATCEGARRLLRAAMCASREHFRHEERDLFPVVERALGLGVLTALGGAFKRASKAKTKGARSARLRL